MPKCSRNDCQSLDATLIPVLELRPWPGYVGQPAELVFHQLSICESCALKHQSPDNFITDEVWGQICATMLRAGKVSPDRASTTLVYRKAGISDADKATLNRIRKYFR